MNKNRPSIFVCLPAPLLKRKGRNKWWKNWRLSTPNFSFKTIVLNRCRRSSSSWSSSFPCSSQRHAANIDCVTINIHSFLACSLCLCPTPRESGKNSLPSLVVVQAITKSDGWKRWWFFMIIVTYEVDFTYFFRFIHSLVRLFKSDSCVFPGVLITLLVDGYAPEDG